MKKEQSAKKVVLILEDEKPLLEAISTKLGIRGFDVVTARTVDQAKQYFADLQHVDAVWLDHYLLGKENGLDFIAWCKNDNNPACQNIPVFVVSNTATTDKVASYMTLGAKKYYVKAEHKMDDIIAEIASELNCEMCNLR